MCLQVRLHITIYYLLLVITIVILVALNEETDMKKDYIHMRISPDDKQELAKAAKRKDQSVTDYALLPAIKRAKKENKENES